MCVEDKSGTIGEIFYVHEEIYRRIFYVSLLYTEIYRSYSQRDLQKLLTERFTEAKHREIYRG